MDLMDFYGYVSMVNLVNMQHRELITIVVENRESKEFDVCLLECDLEGKMLD